MGRVSVNALKPGMILAEDLIHANGRFLLAKGVTLAPTHLRTIKMWGINVAEVEGAVEDTQPAPVSEIDPAVFQAAEKAIQPRFSLTNLDHPFQQLLFRICRLRQAQQIIENPKMLDQKEIVPLEVLRTSERRSASLFPNVDLDPYSLVDEDTSLASLPNIFFEINKVISDPRSSASHIADVISKDTNLSAKLLKIVNSAFYGFPSKIDTISRAVTIVGTKQLTSLAWGTSIISMFKNIPAILVDMKSFWEHSITCGVSARMIASYKNIANAERLFVAGLLHDIGRLVIYKHLPQEGRQMLFKAKEKNSFLRVAELEALGFDHPKIGGILLKKWKLPLILQHAVEYHHGPLHSQYPVEASIVYLADILTNALGIGTSGERFVPLMIPEVWNELGLSPEIFIQIVQLIDRQISEIIHSFFQ